MPDFDTELVSFLLCFSPKQTGLFADSEDRFSPPPPPPVSSLFSV